MKVILPFYCIRWDINRHKVEYYDIIPYLVNEYNKLKSKERPKTIEEIKEFILKVSQYRFWSRCEYEVIISPWPPDDRYSEKIDIYDQIEKNIDTVLQIFIMNI